MSISTMSGQVQGKAKQVKKNAPEIKNPETVVVGTFVLPVEITDARSLEAWSAAFIQTHQTVPSRSKADRALLGNNPKAWDEYRAADEARTNLLRVMVPRLRTANPNINSASVDGYNRNGPAIISLFIGDGGEAKKAFNGWAKTYRHNLLAV